MKMKIDMESWALVFSTFSDDVQLLHGRSRIVVVSLAAVIILFHACDRSMWSIANLAAS